MLEDLKPHYDRLERFTTDINTFLCDRLGYKLEQVASCNPNSTVNANRERVDLYIRFMPPRGDTWPRDSVVIARIAFQPQRSGHGTALLTLLTELSEKYGYSQIGLEATIDQESIQNFVKKYEFMPWQTGQGSRNWIVTVEELKQRLTVVDGYGRSCAVPLP
jgi:hypothetical protein